MAVKKIVIEVQEDGDEVRSRISATGLSQLEVVSLLRVYEQRESLSILNNMTYLPTHKASPNKISK